MKRYVLGLALITFLTYLNSFGNSFVWDDLNNIVNNNALNRPLGLREIFLNPAAQVFYRPIPYFTIWLDWLLWKENPFGYHLTNFIFHLVCIILIFFLTKRLTQSRDISFVSALIFAVHPVHTEAVTYISGRSDLICGFFIFFSFYLYLHFLDSIGKRKILYLCTALFSYLAALFSKEIALIFPFVILCYSFYFYKDAASRLRGKRRLLLSNILFAALAISYLLFRDLFVKFSPMHLSLGKWHLFPKIFLFYLRLLVFPFNLHMQHDLQEDSFLLQVPLFLSILIFLGVIFTAVKLIKERPLRFGMAWFVFWLFPFLGFFKFNSGLAEHWLYIGSFGFFLTAGKFISQRKLLKNKLVSSSIILFFCFLTIQRNMAWRDDVSIYRDTLKYNPEDPRLHYNLGNAYLRKNLLKEAVEEYLVSLKQNPGYAFALNNLTLAKERQLAFADEAYFDHGLYAKALNKFVKDGRVDYASLKSEPFLLNAYLEKAAKLDPQTFNSLPRDEKLALYINVYNAFTLKVIIEHYPIKSIKGIPGVWDRFKVEIAGSKFYLNQIEHEILRKEFKEPRIHFALVCASKSCPELANGPFTGNGLDRQLDYEARKFINDPRNIRLDKKDNILYLSSIFKWFKEDFGEVIEFINIYLPNEEVNFIRENNPRIQYLSYDWSLNE